MSDNDLLGGTRLRRDHRIEQSFRAEAYLIASPVALSQLADAVDKALSSPKGYASVELATLQGESFTLHIIRQSGDVDER